MNKERLQHWALLVLLFAVLYSFLGLLLRAWFEVSSGVLHGDAQIFQAVGRGILNGLTPYADLFETKPPGIFLLHALSLRLFGTQFLVKLLQAATLLALPFLVALPAIYLAADRPASERRFISVLSFLFGILLALYTANQAGEGLTESYGAVFVLLALGMVAGGWGLGVGGSYVILAVLLLLAIGLKEPFLLSYIAGVLLLGYSDIRILRYSAIPLLIAIPIGLIALFLLGYAVPFFQIYLPHMLGYHVLQHDGSTFVHALEVWRTFINIGAYSWWFAGAVTAVWLWAGIRMAGRLADWQISKFALWLGASYAMFLAIAVGGDFYGHHFIFAVPVYAVLWWVVVAHGQGRGEKAGGWVVGILLVCTALFSTRFSYAEAAANWRTEEEMLRLTAAVIDHVMDDCGWEKYLQMVVRGGGPFAYTKHSPYGPVFVHYSRFLGANPLYQSEHIRALREAPLILIDDIENSNLTDIAKQYLGVRYAEDPPACVGEWYTPPEPYHLLFRQSL